MNRLPRTGRYVGPAAAASAVTLPALLISSISYMLGIRAAVVWTVGGDEFLVLVEDAPSSKAVEITAERMVELIGHPIEALGEVIELSASAGVAIFPDDSMAVSTTRQPSVRRSNSWCVAGSGTV